MDSDRVGVHERRKISVMAVHSQRFQLLNTLWIWAASHHHQVTLLLYKSMQKVKSSTMQ